MAYENTTFPNVGDKATATNLSTSGFGVPVKLANLTFVRCHAVVQIQLLGTSYVGEVTAYAQRLDKRLAPVVCR